MSPIQADVLALIKALNAAEFNNWWKPSKAMAFVQIESGFHHMAYRKEPSGVASYGLMQVLDTTAKEYGIDDPAQMFDPGTGLRIGMIVANAYWVTLGRLLGRSPTDEEWAVSYNAGVGGLVRHIKEGDPGFDAAYAHAWDAARNFWVKQGVDA